MSFLEAKRKVAKDMFKFFRKFQFRNPFLIICWDEDAGRIGPEAARYLNEQFNAVPVGDICPIDFFTLAGVAVENDVARLPRTRLFYAEEKNLLVLQSANPQFQHYKFLMAVLDVAEHYCGVEELFTINGFVAPIAHVAERRILAVFNNSDFQKQFRSYNLINMDYEGFPAISSYLLWMAKDRNISAVGLWPEIPFYLLSNNDPQTVKAVIAFLNDRFLLDFDFHELDEQIEIQNRKIENLREENSEIDESLRNLESSLPLGEEEQINIVNAFNELFSRKS
jgi:predicted ATP-grasp superfamily ATP-dependent carboligase